AHKSGRPTCTRSRLRFWFWRDYFLNERFETRLAVERFENRFNIDPAEVRAVSIGVALFQPPKRFFFVTGSEADECAVVSKPLSIWIHFVELGEGVLLDVFVAHFCFSHGQKGQMQRVAAQLPGLFELCDRAR